MRFFVGVCALLALPFAVWSGLAPAAAADEPDAVKLIFESEHLSNIEQGDQVEYKATRSVTNQDLLGLPYSDEITLKVVGAEAAGKKDVHLQIYTGERARDLQKMAGMSINPVFVLYMDQAVNTFSQLAGGKRAYLKRVFSLALKDKAEIKPVKVQYKGKPIDAYRISITPYADDKAAAKMEGWDKSKFVFVVSKQVPGEIVDLHSTFSNPSVGNLTLQDRITLPGVEGVQ